MRTMTRKLSRKQAIRAFSKPQPDAKAVARKTREAEMRRRQIAAAVEAFRTAVRDESRPVQ
jgi:hypothetical protein